MHRSRLILSLLALSLPAGCKSKDEAKAQAAEQRAQALLDVPVDVVYAASAHIRVVDVGVGQSVRGIQLQRAVTSIAFSSDGAFAYVAASDGLREIDAEKHEVTQHLSTAPVRQVLLSPDGRYVYFLEHDVVVSEGGVRAPSAFRLGTYDRDSGQIIDRQAVGERVLQVLPSFAGRHGLVLFESGVLSLVRPGQDWSQAESIELGVGASADPGISIPRPHLALSPDSRRAYLPVEGEVSRVLEIELQTGSTRTISLARPALLRGLALTPDGERLVVNASDKVFLVDVVRAELLSEVALEHAHTGAAMGSDGRRVYLAQTVDGTGGAVTVVRLEPLKVQGKIHLSDISPWVLAVRPRPALALSPPR